VQISNTTIPIDMLRYFTIALLTAFIFPNCTSTGKLKGTREITVPAYLVGKFTDDYGINYNITNSIWEQQPGGKYAILKYDSAGRYFIAKNISGNTKDAGLYSRIDIMKFDNMEPYTWGFCYTVYQLKTFAEAEKAATADRQNPRKGCGGFPFSRMKAGG
jgi:hypothetical protein